MLEALFTAAGAAAWGAVPYESLTPYMDPAAQTKAETLCPGPSGVFVAAFPYYAGRAPGNLSLYARGLDYHEAVPARLASVCAALAARYPGRTFLPGADSSPLPERPAALLAGLGVLGRNHLVLTEAWGSYVFFGTILTDLADYSWPEPRPIRTCENCGKCAAACPGGALDAEHLDPARCLSHLTQYKGELTPTQAALIACHDLIWGCDICQRACPHNRDLPLTPLPEFREDLLPTLAPEDLEGLTNRQFKEKYPRRAFTWRGPEPLRRNLRLQSEARPADPHPDM